MVCVCVCGGIFVLMKKKQVDLYVLSEMWMKSFVSFLIVRNWMKWNEI